MNYNMRQYSKEVEKLIITEPKNRLIENVLGLGEEAGEVQGKVKKLVRDKAFSNSFEDLSLSELKSISDIIKELGDCLFYVTAIANYRGSNLQEVANINLNKLHDRQKRNKLQGSGDDR